MKKSASETSAMEMADKIGKTEKVENEFTKMNREIWERKLPGCKIAMVALHRTVEIRKARGRENLLCPILMIFPGSIQETQL